MEALIVELKHKIVEALNLVDIAPEDIDPDAQLIGGDLGLDSIDVLELVMMLEKDYGVQIDSKELGAKVFASIRALAEYVHLNRSEIKPVDNVGDSAGHNN
jgi:acyl carrier protein